MKIRSMQTCIMSSLPRCIFRCSVFRYVTLDNFFQTLLFNCNSFTLVANKYLLTYLPLNNSDTSFSVDINSPSKSLKGVLLIFTKERSTTKFTHNTEEFFNPKITKVEVTVEGVPNELYLRCVMARVQY